MCLLRGHKPIGDLVVRRPGGGEPLLHNAAIPAPVQGLPGQTHCFLQKDRGHHLPKPEWTLSSHRSVELLTAVRQDADPALCGVHK